MKISMVVPTYMGAEKMLKLLKHLTNQTTNDFELILVIDTNKQQILNIVDEYKKNFKHLKVIFNTKRCGRSLALKQGIQNASGEYTILASTSFALNKTSIEELNKLANKFKGVDVIEFKAAFKSPIKTKGTIRKRFIKPIKIVDRKEVIAYANPFTMFRLVKTEVLKSIPTNYSLAPLNSSYSINSTYLSLLNAETFVNVSLAPFTINSKLNKNFNPPKMIRQWKRMIAFIGEQYPEYVQEIHYAYYYTLSVYISAFVHISKNKITINKVKEEYKKFIEECNFFKTNKYILSNSVEAKLLRENKLFTKSKGLYKKI